MNGPVKTRRRMLGLIGAGALAPRLVLAQAARVPLVSVLFIGDADDESAARTFFDTMARHGWVEGKNISYERHSGKGTLQYLETMVSNAAGSEPDLIVATTAGIAAQVLKENASLPMVFVTMSDPVANGLVANLARPGRNATGSYQTQGDASHKRFAFVHQAFPGMKRMGAVFDRNAADYQRRKAAHQKSARAHGIELVAQEFTNFEAIAKLFAQYKRDGVRVVEVTPSFQVTGRRREAVALAERNEIALVAHRSEWADAGAVLTYGVDVGENYRRAANLANRVLKGQKPADIAVEMPNRLELVVNSKAALALGHAIPKPLLQQATRVIS